MKHRFFVVGFCVALLFSAAFLPLITAQGNTPSVDLAGYRWNKTTLHALTVTNESEPWWQPYFVTLTQRAVVQWNQAFQYFATNFTDYAYMNAINIVLDVSNQTLPDYDIYINFTESIAIGSSDALGLTTTVPYKNGTVEYAVVELSSKNGNVDLTQSNQRDVCGHELGRALGLGHSNSSMDLMYPYYDLYSSGNAVSTLDFLGLATSFSWLNSTDNESTDTPLPQFVVLPSTLPYAYAPVTNPAPKGIGDNPLVRTLQILFSDPFTTIMVIAFFAFLVVAGLVYVSIRKQRQRAKRPSPYLGPAQFE
jgi:hypothetical protein